MELSKGIFHKKTRLSTYADSRPHPAISVEDKAKSLLNVLRGYEEFTLDTNGIIISSNLEVVSITGYEEWEVIGRHFSMFYTEEEILEDKPTSDLTMAQIENKVKTEAWKLKKRSAKFWAKIKITPIYDSIKTLTGYRLILRDATHKAFHDYKLGQQKKTQFYNYSSIGLIEFGLADGRIALINQYATELFGENNDAIFFHELFLEKAEYDKFISCIENDRHVNNFEFQLTNNKWISIDCKFFLKRGLVEGLMTDITDRKLHEQKVMNLSEDLDTFIYHASHDLRSPLTSILGILNLMETEESIRHCRQYSSMIKERINHLDNLLRELSAVTYNNSTPLVIEKIFVKGELQALLREFQSIHHVKIYLEIADDFSMATDLNRFRSVMRQLISNGIKFRNQFLPESYIRIAITNEQCKTLVNVTDNGIGIQETQLDKLFNPFYKGTSSISGNGLGLYIVKSMIEKLGGTVLINSVAGTGTHVLIELPN